MQQNTVLITGGTGYVGSWIVKKMLDKGYHIRLAVRQKANKKRYAHLLPLATHSQGTLTVVEADLLKPGSYDKAAEGAQAIIHAASPFKLRVKNPEKDLLKPALEGTRNILKAATNSSTVKKVVLTSSVAAIVGDNIDMRNMGITQFTEEHFNEAASLSYQPYSFSKVEAEKEAWRLYRAQSDWKLVVMNPSFVMGPPIGDHPQSESVQFMQNMLSGLFRFGAPDLHFGFVDVRDVADAHLLGLEQEEASGRHILAERTASMLDVSQLLRATFGNKYPLPTKKSPVFLLSLLGWMFGLNRTYIQRNVGIPIALDNSRSIEKLGLSYHALSTTLEDMVHELKQSKP